MTPRSVVLLGLVALAVAGLVVTLSIRADLRRERGYAAEHESARGTGVHLP